MLCPVLGLPSVYLWRGRRGLYFIYGEGRGWWVVREVWVGLNGGEEMGSSKGDEGRREGIV